MELTIVINEAYIEKCSAPEIQKSWVPKVGHKVWYKRLKKIVTIHDITYIEAIRDNFIFIPIMNKDIK